MTLPQLTLREGENPDIRIGLRKTLSLPPLPEIFSGIAGLLAFLLLMIAVSPPKLSAQQNAVPVIDQPLVPTSVAPGGPGFTMMVNGAGFAPGAVVKWNGNSRATSFVGPAQLSASILPSDVVNVGTASISVTNPSPGGGTSNAVEFPVADPRGAVTLARTDYSGAQVPAGLASGDFNGDGALDLVASNEGDNTVSVFLGDGHGSFSAKQDYATGVTPYTAAVGDFNGDGILDLVVPNSDCVITATTCTNPQGSVSILLGNGDGTFKTHVDYSSGIWTTAVMVGDFNSDGKLDVIAVNGTCPGVPCSTTSSSISVLLGNGDGTFQPPAAYTVGLRPVSGVVSDFNGDGKLDIAVSNDFNSTVSVLLGNGDGTFQDQKVFPIGPHPGVNGEGKRPAGIVTADFNRDGRLDLAVADEGVFGVGSSFSILLGNGDGTFQPEVEYATGESPQQPAYGDFNGDGILDIVLTNRDSNTVSLYIGNGDGTFQPQMSYATAAQPSGLVSADFDGDGRLDVAVAAEIKSAPTGIISTFLTAATTPTVTVSPSASSITTAQDLTVAIEVGGENGKPTPTGSVTLTSGSYISTATTLDGGDATIMIPPSSLAAGTDTLAVRYNADANGSAIYNSALGTASVTVKTTPTVTVTPTSSSVTTAQSLMVEITVYGQNGSPAPTGSVTLTSGTYASAASTLSAGSSTINIPAGSLAVGIDTLTVTYSGDNNYSATTGTAAITVVSPSFMLSGTTITVAPGATTGNTSTITITSAGGFTGSVVLTAAVTSSPAGAQFPPTLSFGSTSPVNISGASAGTATLTVSTTAPTSASLRPPILPGIRWYDGTALACLLVFGISAPRRRSWKVLGMLMLLATFCSCLLACGGGGGSGGGKVASGPGTTAGIYTIAITGASGVTTETGTVTLTVQ
jgi:hypothetical protein